MAEDPTGIERVEALTDTAALLLKGLNGHLGAEKAVTSKKIERSMKLSGSSVRDGIRELRRSGFLVGSISKRKEQEGGYFICVTSDEYKETRKHLENRVMSIKSTIASMDRQAQANFGGQLRLPKI